VAGFSDDILGLWWMCCVAVVKESIGSFTTHVQSIDGDDTDLCPDGIVCIFWSRVAPYVVHIPYAMWPHIYGMKSARGKDHV